MSNFKQTAEKWAEEVLAKQPSAEEVEKQIDNYKNLQYWVDYIMMIKVIGYHN